MAWARGLAGARRPGGTLALAGLIVAGAFALGGSARPDVASLEILRPLAAAALVAEIDQARGERNLSSAVRVWLLKQAAAQ